MAKNKGKSREMTVVGQRPNKVQKELFPVTEVDVDGVPMGVLNDGTPYLTARGLARICNVNVTSILRMGNEWHDERAKPRGQIIQGILNDQGYLEDVLYYPIVNKGVENHAYPDKVCMAILEYHAFERDNLAALRNYRLLARVSLRAFIYNRCGYDPNNRIPESWRNYHARVLLNDQLPVGYFSVFREIADIVIHMIQSDCPIDSHTVPDISVGKVWSSFWSGSGFDEAYGERLKHPHNYPEWFPQSSANPVECWIYPVEALGEFRKWLYRNYVPQNFPKYLEGKVGQGHFLPSSAELVIAAVTKKELPRIKKTK